MTQMPSSKHDNWSNSIPNVLLGCVQGEPNVLLGCVRGEANVLSGCVQGEANVLLGCVQGEAIYFRNVVEKDYHALSEDSWSKVGKDFF